MQILRVSILLFFALRIARKWILALLLLASCAAALRAQTIQIELVNGVTGRSIVNRPLLNVWVGHERKFPFEIRMDKHGVALLLLTHNDNEINVPECKGMQADSEKLQMNPNKKDEEEFNKKYKYCTAFEVNNPIVRFADSISIGPVIRTVNGTTYFQYVPCWVNTAENKHSWLSSTDFSTEQILQHGIVTANACGKATILPQPGHLVFFVRLPTNRETWRQAWN